MHKHAVRLVVSALLASLVVLATSTPNAAAAQERASVHVRTTSSPSGVWLHARLADHAEWADLCAAPCEADLDASAELGLSLEGLSPQRVASPALSEGALLRLRYEDHHLTRTYGLILTVIGVVGALTLGLGGVISWVSANGLGDMTGPVTAMVTSAGVLALGLSVGIVLMNEGDRIEISLGAP